MPSASRLRISPRPCRRWPGRSPSPARPPARPVPPRPPEAQRTGWGIIGPLARGNERMFERIVAAIERDPERSARVMEAVKELAQKFSSEVLVAHVREVERPAAMVAPTAKAGAIPPALHFESEEEAREFVDAA